MVQIISVFSLILFFIHKHCIVSCINTFCRCIFYTISIPSTIWRVNASNNINVSAISDNSKILFETRLCDILHLSTDSVANTLASLFYQGGSSLQPHVTRKDDIRGQPRTTRCSSTEERREEDDEDRARSEYEDEEWVKTSTTKKSYSQPVSIGLWHTFSRWQIIF